MSKTDEAQSTNSHEENVSQTVLISAAEETDEQVNKISFWDRLFTNSKFTLLLSLFIGVLVWGYVVIYQDPSTTIEISNIEVVLNTDSTVLTHFNLTPVDWLGKRVTVSVSGDRMDLEKLTPSDFKAVLSLDSVNGEGTYTLPVQVTTSLTHVEIVPNTKKPDTVQVSFDRLKESVFKLSVLNGDFELPSDDVVKANPVISPQEVTVSGPSRNIDRIASAKVELLDTPKVIADSYIETGEIVFYDEDGVEVSKTNMRLDKETAMVRLFVLVMKDLPIDVRFLNIPPSVDMETEFQFSLSEPTVRVAGPKKEMDTLTTIMLGPVNFKDITMDYREVLPIQVPQNCENVSGLKEVIFTVDIPNLNSIKLNTSNIIARNLPPNFEVQVETEVINDIEIVGDESLLEGLTGNDIYANLDFSDREIKAGKIVMPVTILVPNKKGVAWAVGDHTVVVTISEKTEESDA